MAPNHFEFDLGRSQRDFNVTLGTLVYNDGGLYPGSLNERNECPSHLPVVVEGLLEARTESAPLSGIVESVFPALDNDVFVQTQSGDDKDVSAKLMSNLMICVVITLLSSLV